MLKGTLYRVIGKKSYGSLMMITLIIIISRLIL